MHKRLLDSVYKTLDSVQLDLKKILAVVLYLKKNREETKEDEPRILEPNFRASRVPGPNASAARTRGPNTASRFSGEKVKPRPSKTVICGVPSCMEIVHLSEFDAHCNSTHANLGTEDRNFYEIPVQSKQSEPMDPHDIGPRRSGRKLRRNVTKPKAARPASNLIQFFESFIPEELKNR